MSMGALPLVVLNSRNYEIVTSIISQHWIFLCVLFSNKGSYIHAVGITIVADDLGPVSLKIFPTEFKFDGNLILLSPKF